MATQLMFYVLATVAVGAALGMVLSRSPINSALWLVLNLFCVAGLYLTLNATFIAVIQVLVYAGAIMVLFLFVIMLLNLSEKPTLQDFDWAKGVAFVLAMIIMGQLVYVAATALDVVPDTITPATAAVTGTAEVIALDLFTRFVLPLEVIAIMLLAATIGAVMLAKRRFV